MNPIRPLLCVCLLAFCGNPSASNLRIGGMAQWEHAHVGDAPASLRDGYGEWSRIRLAASGAVRGADWKLEYDFVSDVVTDAYLRLPWRGGRFWVGQFKQPLYMESLISDSEPLLIAPAGNAPFGIGRRLGLQYQRSFEQGRWQVSAYGRDIEVSGPEKAVAARVYGGREWENGRLHLGAGLAFEDQSRQALRFRLRPEARSTIGHWQNGGSLLADRVQRFGVEFGLQKGNWLLQSEWQGLRAEGEGSDRSARNAYATLAWAAFGTPRAYRDGLFVSPPRQDRGVGGIELVLRYAQTALPSVAGGDIEQSSLSAGINMSIARHWRFQANLSHANGAGRQEAEVLGVRAQYTF
jgi:phosphate-selective porin